MDEQFETFTSIFNYLKNKYNFNPKNIKSDFRMSQINRFKNVFLIAIYTDAFFILASRFGEILKNMVLGGKVSIREIMNYY